MGGLGGTDSRAMATNSESTSGVFLDLMKIARPLHYLDYRIKGQRVNQWDKST
jgi:hypothetical protein